MESASGEVASAREAANLAPASAAPPASALSPAEARAALLSLILVSPAKRSTGFDVGGFLDKTVGPGTPAKMNQGNAELARHVVGRDACLAKLAGVTLQTDEQRSACGGEPNMVPVYAGGKVRSAKVCVDVFEYPNRACELPMVWVAPTQAATLCELAGKRLCTQDEWSLACRADPAGGPDWRYAYGDQLDLDVCNSDKPAASFGPPLCDPDSALSAWRTCRTNTEPSGAFPQCRSRLGVFDLHGNVAEIMTRRDPADGVNYSQLKGSAFFYVDVARKPDERPPAGHETYPDHCNFDPRWHVEPMTQAWHVNYHLGFRCCKPI